MTAEYLASRLADYTITYSLAKTDPEAVRLAKRSLCDTVGCMIAASRDSAVKTAGRFVREMEGGISLKDGTFAVGDPDPHADRYTALICGTAANTLDFDDISVVMNGHPSAVILPALLGAAQNQSSFGTVTGEAFLEAYITGVEAASALGRAVCPASFIRGWHCTAVLGIFGAVAALGKLQKADAKTLRNAFTIAASEAGGVKANLGSPVKPFHCGRSAGKSFEILALANAGCGGNPNAIEAETGLFPLIAGEAKTEETIMALDSGKSVFLDPGIALKPYPSCKRTLNGIDCALEIRKELENTEDISEIRCFVQTEAAGEFGGPIDTAEGRKLSLPYCAAAALYYGRADLEVFEQEPDPEMKRLISLISVQADPSLDSMEADATRIVIALKDGTRIEKFVEYAKGDRRNPMTEEEVRGKFMSCCRGHLGGGDAAGLWDEMNDIEKKESVQGIVKYLRLAE